MHPAEDWRQRVYPDNTHQRSSGATLGSKLGSQQLDSGHVTQCETTALTSGICGRRERGGGRGGTLTTQVVHPAVAAGLIPSYDPRLHSIPSLLQPAPPSLLVVPVRETMNQGN